MPLYDYKCKEHGFFHQLATMAESASPKPCPECQTLSARIIMIPPEILAMAPNQKKAAEANEKAMHEPTISTVDTRMEDADRKAFELRKSCGCHHHSNNPQVNQKLKQLRDLVNPSQSSLKQQALFLADGSKIFPSQRPWMISH